MAIATKPRPSAHTKKRQAQHHRRNKSYLKTYFPYMPMLAIVLSGIELNSIWTPSLANAQSTTSLSQGTRLAVITGNHSNNLLYAVLSITFMAFAAFLISHWYRIHRLLNRGEMFIVRHPVLDVSLVLIVTAGVVITRR